MRKDCNPTILPHFLRILGHPGTVWNSTLAEREGFYVQSINPRYFNILTKTGLAHLEQSFVA